MFLFLVFTTEVFSKAEDDYVFPYLMRAIDRLGNSALFVATQHEYPWEAFPEWFKEQILSRNVAVVESIENEEQEEETLRLFSKESLMPEVFLPEEQSWNIPFYHEEFQEKYSRIAQLMQERGYDYSYLNNIRTVNPGLLAWINLTFLGREKEEEGIDSSIESTFKQRGKKVIPLETLERESDYFSITSAKYEDVSDSFNLSKLSDFVKELESLNEEEEELELSSPNFKETEDEEEGAAAAAEDLNAVPSFQEEIRHLENLYFEDCKVRSILTFDHALPKRNKRWIPTILEQVSTNKAVIAAGDFHFVGPDGILSLGQDTGLRWQYYNNETGEWENFRYEPRFPQEA
ncbi:MAG: hypothetical protein BGO67_02535 [Alphaproteobacteria bacterium 41-28]|nr:MAG: hypothetical protein BGO67_02535 [Alphaproteobacteria bacterium 41-28]